MVPIEESFGFNRTTLCVVMICATGIFVWHSSTILGRYLVNSVSESVFSVRNVSLILPVVNMQLERQRRAPIPNDTVLHRMGFRALIDDKKVPDWASPVRHDHTPSKAMEVGLHSITVNRVSLEVKENRKTQCCAFSWPPFWPLSVDRRPFAEDPARICFSTGLA